MHRSSVRSAYDGKIAGLYDLEETLGRGHFAVVKSARHVFTGEKVAVKVIDKSKLDEVSRAHLFQEVRCMKLVQHPNVVRLYEVIDTQTKLYLILELGDGGDLYDYIMRHEAGLAERTAREYFRQIVRAISYCHRLHVVHRDLKPENVVFFEKLGMVKLTDFGFSNRFDPGQKLETSCGSLAYSAPEILLGDSYDAPAVDVWSLGVILYMLVCGQAPFQEANDSETLTMIMDVKYTIPAHVSDACKRLIGRMLVREPERRASLDQIATDPWLGVDSNTEPADFLPLISREHVSDEDHAFIIQKMVNGNIASKEDILEALDKNEYNHITATYFLLAERKLRAHRQEQATTNQKLRSQILPLSLSVSKPFVKVDSSTPQAADSPTDVNQSLLSVARTPGDAPANYRVRKCSIVQEEEDEDDIGGAGREELAPPHCSLNRRGSRSEGKLNLALQERLAESERRKETVLPNVPVATSGIVRVNVRDDSRVKTPVWIPAGKRNLPLSNDLNPRPVTAIPKLYTNPTTKWKMGENKKCVPPAQLPMPKSTSMTNTAITTSIITESSTISMPLKPAVHVASSIPKYKTMPSPTRTLLSSPQSALNEIFEEGDEGEGAARLGRGFTGGRGTAYEQRRSKFHKARTASCSSSDASDDDSESRKKRAHKLNAEGKPLSQRRDSHDDSSDSQDPSGGGGGAGGGGGGTRQGGAEYTGPSRAADVSDDTHQSSSGGHGGTGESRQCASGAQQPFSRRHRAGRRRAGETRLRESQSLNRITEVQEVSEHTVVQTSVTTHTSSSSYSVATKSRSFGARLLQGWSLSTSSKRTEKTVLKEKGNSRRDSSASDPSELCVGLPSSKDDTTVKLPSSDGAPERRRPMADWKTVPVTNCAADEKENCKLPKTEKQKSGKKVRMLSRYFQMHKKLCLPLPGLFGRGRLYKAQSCSSIVRDRVNPPTTASVVPCGNDRWCTVAGNRGEDGIEDKPCNDGDINQNLGIVRSTPRLDSIVPIVANCAGIRICNIHLGDASKCCQLC